MNVMVVIPVGGGREQNLKAVMASVEQQTIKPKFVVLVCDGEAAWREANETFKLPTVVLNMRKHEPGLEQPRNVGVRLGLDIADKEGIQISHVWFLDSDCVVGPSALAHYLRADYAAGPDFAGNRILIGPYDWLAPGNTEPLSGDENGLEMLDPRWESFRSHDPTVTRTNDLSAGLACFSGNLIWPITEFVRVGGFWNELHHGRCEDGELGLRAVAMGVPIAFVAEARAWHLWHTRNMDWILNANTRDVPMLNERHPWVEGEGLFVVEEDGKRFNVRCVCGWEGNTAEIWDHTAICPKGVEWRVTPP